MTFVLYGLMFHTFETQIEPYNTAVCVWGGAFVSDVTLRTLLMIS